MSGRNGSRQNFPMPADDFRGAARQRQSARASPAAARCSRWRCPCRAAAGSRARAGTGLAELFVLALAPSVAFAALAPFVGEQFAVGRSARLRPCAFVGASVFFAVAVFLSTLFNDVWRPLLLTCLRGSRDRRGGLRLPEGHGLFAAMAGGSYF